MAKFILSEKQIQKLKESINEGKDGNYMAKEQLYTIATLAMNMWELMEENEELDDWMETKIAQAEQSIISVVKSYLYNEEADESKGMEKLGYDELVIGK
jgi:hypothetical protein